MVDYSGFPKVNPLPLAEQVLRWREVEARNGWRPLALPDIEGCDEETWLFLHPYALGERLGFDEHYYREFSRKYEKFFQSPYDDGRLFNNVICESFKLFNAYEDYPIHGSSSAFMSFLVPLVEQCNLMNELWKRSKGSDGILVKTEWGLNLSHREACEESQKKGLPLLDGILVAQLPVVCPKLPEIIIPEDIDDSEQPPRSNGYIRMAGTAYKDQGWGFASPLLKIRRSWSDAARIRTEFECQWRTSERFGRSASVFLLPV